MNMNYLVTFLILLFTTGCGIKLADIEELNSYTVDQTDDDASTTGFGGGTHDGTLYESNYLTLNTTTNNSELDESWAPEWGSLVAYWTFENSWEDQKGNADGTPILTAGFSSDSKVGASAGSFDNNGYVQITLDETIQNDSYSISLWFKTTSTEGDKFVSFAFNKHPLEKWTSTLRYCNVTCQHGSVDINDGEWHHMMVVGNGTNHRVFLDGSSDPDITFASELTGSLGDTIELGRERILAGALYDGLMDDLAIWNTPLDEDQIRQVYLMQAPKYSGNFHSRIIDSFTEESSWTNLDWITSFPFGKEIPEGGGSASSETQTHYTELSSNTTMDGLIALYRMNTVGATAGAYNDIEDKAIQGVSGELGGDPELDYTSPFGVGTNFDGNDYIDLSTGSELDFGTNSFSISLWFKTSDNTTANRMISKGHYGWGPGYIVGMALDADPGSVGGGVGGGGMAGAIFARSVDTSFNDGKWHHLVMSVDRENDRITFYGDAVAQAMNIHAGTCGTPTADYIDISGCPSLTGTSHSFRSLAFARAGEFNGAYFPGSLDEISFWDRALSASDVVELYRRGANRVKFQIRVCGEPDCSDQEVAEGHGWMGPGGNHYTFFSENLNNSWIDASCGTEQACFPRELLSRGELNTSSPAFYFSNFGSEAILVNDRRYFQYRVFLESDDENNVCEGSTTCMPKLESVTIGPAHNYVILEKI